MVPLRVIGAGPCGSVAAISALECGHSVHIYEQKETPGENVRCSGLISKEGLESLSGFTNYKKHALNKIRGAIFDCAGYKLKVDSGRDIAYVIDREGFDASLAQKAQDEGAKLFCGKRALPPFGEGSIIGADGPGSMVASHFGFPKIRRFAGTAQATIRHDGQFKDYVRVFLSNDKFPGFFGWVIPHNEEYAEAGVGCVLPSNPDAALDCLSRLIGTSIPKERRYSVIPLERRRKTALSASRRNILLVGDAAGQVKSTTGGGVVFGTKCAKLAGKYATSPKDYENAWKALYGHDLDAHYQMHRALGRLSDSSLRAIGSIASAFRVEEFLEKEGNMDSPMRMIWPGLLLHPIRTLVPK
ncbi:NAD(P)/FAD-dependent oxidoreductase [Candidatus Micrarchaeota archaeon]|nr:NAD(P)/FAD-dependent oxidoreductase [Candidatus Micrarchaeota archaeon]